MPCTNCMAKYSLLRKEHGCSSCGFGFCAKCLPHRILLKKLADKPMPVCTKCYKKHTNEELEVSVPTTNSSNWGKTEDAPASFRDLYPKVSKTIKQKPQESIPSDPSGPDDEMAERLAKLIGRDKDQILNPMKMVVNQPEDGSSGSSILKRMPTNNETPEQLIKRTLDDPQVKFKAQFDETHKMEMKQLEERLAKLRDKPVDLIQNPRLMVTNDVDIGSDLSDMELPDEAKELINAAEQKLRKKEPHLFAYENEALDSDSDGDMKH